MRKNQVLVTALQQIAAGCSAFDASRIARTALQQAGLVIPSESKMGRRVTWQSQAHGSCTTKTGVVVDIVAPKHRPDPRFDLKQAGPPREHESYVIAVDVGAVPGCTFRHYWPRVAGLTWLPAN